MNSTNSTQQGAFAYVYKFHRSKEKAERIKTWVGSGREEAGGRLFSYC